MASIIKVPQAMVEHVREASAAISSLVNVKINVGPDGTVELHGDPLDEQRVSLVIKALARGFQKEDAISLLNFEYDLRVIDLKDYFNSKSHFKRIKARVIGRGGSIKRSIESATSTNICVSGNHISIIGPYYSLPYAEEAVRMLIMGSKHSTLGNYLARKRRELIYIKLRGEKNV